MRSLGERRNIVYDISEEHACDRNWFDPLYRDLENGGYGEFLDFLQNLVGRLASAANSQDGRDYRTAAHERRQCFPMGAGLY